METDSAAAASASAPRDARQHRNMSIYNEDHAPSPSTGALCSEKKAQCRALMMQLLVMLSQVWRA